MANSKDKGDISEAVIIAELLKVGIPVSKPVGDNQPYDLIMDLDGILKKVQVKTGRLREGCVIFNSCNSINTYLQRDQKYSSYRGKVDFIAVYCPDNDESYIVPIEDCMDARTSLRIAEAKNGQLKRLRWAKDYLLAGSLMVKASS